MSEDQIRMELAEMRTLQRESHYELTESIKRMKDEIIASVENQHEKFCERIVNEQKEHRSSTRWVLALFITIITAFVSWVAIDHLDLKSEQKALSNDFGQHLLGTAYQNKETVGFEKMLDKYYPSRGKTE